MEENHYMQFLQCPTSVALRTWLKSVTSVTPTTATRVSNARDMSAMRQRGDERTSEERKVEVLARISIDDDVVGARCRVAINK